MDIPQNQIVTKRKVGKAKGSDITYIKLMGGLHLVVDKKGIVLGTGPHREVAKHLAQKFEPDIEWTELSKSDHVDFGLFEHILPEYEALTNQFRKAQGVK